MRQDYVAMVDDYMRSSPDVDWETNEVFFVLEPFEAPGQVKVGGHRLIDWDKNRQIEELMCCCCGREGCTW